MHCIALHCIALHCIALHCIALHCIVFHVLYCITLYCITLYCIVLYCIVLYCIVLYCIVLYCIVLYCIVLYYIALLLYYIALYCIVLHSIAFNLYAIVWHCIALYFMYCIALSHRITIIYISPQTPEDGEKASSDMNKINKLIEIMKNVVNQNGFEYEGKRIKNKAATEGKSTSVGRTTTSGWLDDMVMAKLKADEYLKDFLLRRKAAEKADLDAIGKIDREKNNGAAGEEKTASAEIDACDSISKGQKMSANFEDVIKIKKETRGGEVCFTTMQVSHEEPAAGIEEDFSTTEQVTSSVADEGNGEAPDRGNEQLLEKDTELEEASRAENERTSEEELNTEGYSDSQRKNVEDLHVQRSAGEEVTGAAPSGEDLTTEHYADTQKQNSFIVCSSRAPRTSANQQFSQKIAEARSDSDEGRSDDTDTPSYAGENSDHVDVDDAHVNTLSESRDETIVGEVQPPGQ